MPADKEHASKGKEAGWIPDRRVVVFSMKPFNLINRYAAMAKVNIQEQQKALTNQRSCPTCVNFAHF